MGRRDARLVKNLDSMHIIVPLLYPGRCDNEAFISERIDLTNIDAWLEKKNAELKEAAKREITAAETDAAENTAASETPGTETDGAENAAASKTSGTETDGAENAAASEISGTAETAPDVFRYTLFHLIVTAVMKTLRLRPKMNYFIQNKRIYERNEITSSFVVKKKFSDHGAEALAIVRGEDSDTVETIREKIRTQVYAGRSEKKDASTEAMDIVSKMPFFLVRFFVWLMRQFDIFGKVPRSLIDSDPYYTSAVLSNLGSIRLKSGYHHLTNWGTNSLIVIIGETKKRPFFHDDGTFDMRDSVDLGITIDERLADGYYYSKSIRLVKKLLENPELLERPLAEEVDYD